MIPLPIANTIAEIPNSTCKLRSFLGDPEKILVDRGFDLTPCARHRICWCKSNQMEETAAVIVSPTIFTGDMTYGSVLAKARELGLKELPRWAVLPLRVMTPEQEAGNENHIVAIHKPIPFELTGQELAEAKSCGITSPISDLMTLVGRPGDGKPFLWGHWVSGPEQKFAGGSIPAPFFAFGIAA